MERPVRLLLGRAVVIVTLLTSAAPLLVAQGGDERPASGEKAWAAQILMKIRGTVRWDAEGFFTTWPDSVDMAVAVVSAPSVKEEQLPKEPVATGWRLPLAPATGLGPTKTRVRLSASKEVSSGWELKSAVLLTPKAASVSHYPADVVFEIAEAGPGYRLELRGFKSGGPAFQARGTPTLFAPGAEHQIVGEVKLGNLVITGDDSYPPTFRFTQAGYQHLYGRGGLKVGPSKEYSFGEKDSVDYWTSRAQSPEDWIREAAAGALGFLPKDDSEKQAALSLLMVLAKDRVATVRRNAAESLGRLKNSSALALLEQMSTGDKDEWVKKVASWAKARIQK